jgi:putative glutamine amidotransferase
MVSLISPKKPVVGISGGNADSASVRAMMAQIQAAGAIPLLLSNFSKRNPAKDIHKIDALVVMGNDYDIDPTLYNQKRHEKTKAENDTPEGIARANYEFAIMQMALSQGMPLLGICGGMQRLNVLLGGDLHQHVPDFTGNDDHAQQAHNIAPFIPVQAVTFENISTLRIMAGGITSAYTPAHGISGEAVFENSMHHQAVKTVGQGLRVAARADDQLPDGSRLIEAIEADPTGPLKDQFALGVQWHPEFGASALGARIATSLVSEASRFADVTQRAHPPGEAQDETIESALDKVQPQENAKTAIGSITAKILARRSANTSQLAR